MDEQQGLEDDDQHRLAEDEALFPSTSRAAKTDSGEQVGGDESDRSPDDELILQLLGEGLSHVQVATQCSVSTKTIQRRLRDPAFAAEVTERRRERVAATASRLVKLGDDAVGVISNLLSGESDTIRLQAARSVLDLGGRYHRSNLLERELANQIAGLKRILDGLSSESGGSS